MVTASLCVVGCMRTNTCRHRARFISVMQASDIYNIKYLLQMEADLKKPCAGAAASLERDAKVNLLAFFKIQTVLGFEAAYDDLYYELHKNGRLQCVLDINPDRSKELLQPRQDLHDRDETPELEEQLQFYLAAAELSKGFLEELVEEVVEGLEGCEVLRAEVKAIDSTRRKASAFCDGDVRKIADMARVSVVCDEPKDLERVYLGIMERLEVSKGVKICGKLLILDTKLSTTSRCLLSKLHLCTSMGENISTDSKKLRENT